MSHHKTTLFKWLKFHFGEPENSCIFAELLVPLGGIICLGLKTFFYVYLMDLIYTVYLCLFSSSFFYSQDIFGPSV